MKNVIHITTVILLVVLGVVGCKKKEIEGFRLEPKMTSYYPNSGKAGTLVTIEGEGFGTDISEYTATIGGKPVEVISATEMAVVMRMPETGTSGNIELKFNGKTLSIGAYTYQDLTIKSIFPTNGGAGTQVRIEGEGFGSMDKPAEVFVNGIKALVVSASDKVIVAEIPENSGSGAVAVKVDGKQSQGQRFKYQGIFGVKPLTGGKGTKVVINGDGFETDLKGNVVDFNGKVAVVLEATEKQLVVIAPDDVSTGPLSVNINSQKITGPAFTVVGKPIIQTVSPLSGPKGAEMTITGDIFSKELDENKVYINNVLIPIKSASNNEIKLDLPGGTGSGIVRLVVNDQAVVGPEFKDQNLGIISLTPDNGLTGTTITINGMGFSTNVSENKVYFDGVLATVKTATENKLVLDAPEGLRTGAVRVTVAGLEAVAPVQFRRAGVMTLAGGPNSDLFENHMTAIALDLLGNVYVTDTQAKKVKKITPSGTVSVLQVNGSDAVFSRPYGITIDKQNNIYVGDMETNEIVKITSSGQRSVYASGFPPAHLTINDNGMLYAGVNQISGGVMRIATPNSAVRFPGPFWVNTRPLVDNMGNFYYADQNSGGNNSINFAGVDGSRVSNWVGYSDGGTEDGVGDNARFYGVSSIAMSKNKLYTIESYVLYIREIDPATRTVKTIYKPGNGRGFQDGSLFTAKFNGMNDFAVDKDGNMYILDAANKAIRKVFFQ
ncbi:IPT/TIG domain-containing protein [Sphingobacterium sp. Mn56C]|uniref:IPT/TIG domain-containing protein n=1 Tax=Sphingobacterium sp. Mn56C TaxID=3395261 RepID=UPI003BE5D9C5